MYSITLRVNHLDIDHSLNQKRIPVLLRRFDSLDIVFIFALKEVSCIPELQTILFLRYYDAAIRLIALMGNAIMQSL